MPREIYGDSSIREAMGESPEQEEEIHEHFARLFREQPPERWEREKTPEEIAIIRGLNDKVNYVVREHGGKPLNISPDHVHIVDESKLEALPERLRGALQSLAGHARFVPEMQAIFAYPKSDKGWGPYNKLNMAEVLGHEMLHFNSYFLAKQEDQARIGFRRGGWIIFSEKYGDLFVDIDEAVVSKLEHRLSRDYLGDIPELQDEYRERELLIQRVFGAREKFYKDPVFVKTSPAPNGGYETTMSPYAYSEERHHMDKILRDIQKAMPERFSSEDAVFDEFAGALFTGKILEIARIVEAARGRGAFRTLAKETQKPKIEPDRDA